MISEKCPDCGAGVAPNATECSYCGSVLVPTNPVVKWTAIKDHLPPASPTDPIRSINVLGCFGMNGGRVKMKDGSIFDGYPGSLRPVYYDFKNKGWNNDFYGIRMYPISITHWRPLPEIGLPDWIPVARQTPQTPLNEDFSIHVLTCDKNIDYEGSVISAHISFKYPHWVAPLDLTNPDEDALGQITISHWMPEPERPTG